MHHLPYTNTMKKFKNYIITVIVILIIYFVGGVFNGAVQEVNDAVENENQGSKNLDEVRFVRVVDGDTVIVTDSAGKNRRVRMIGIDTPESVAVEEERNNEYGVMASDYTKELLSNAENLYLEYDVDNDDQYDRILAYVWLSDVNDTFDDDNIKNYMVNAIIVKNGYGVAKTYKPTVAHDDYLHQLMEDAKSNSKGLWQFEGFRKLW